MGDTTTMNDLIIAIVALTICVACLAYCIHVYIRVGRITREIDRLNRKRRV